jgi:hypothetical protein
MTLKVGGLRILSSKETRNNVIYQSLKLCLISLTNMFLAGTDLRPDSNVYPRNYLNVFFTVLMNLSMIQL